MPLLQRRTGALAVAAAASFLPQETLAFHNPTPATLRPAQKVTAIFARSPPKGKFDLDAILAFEETLKEEEAKGPVIDGGQDHALDPGNSSIDGKRPSNAGPTYIIPDDLHDKRIDAVVSHFVGEELSRSQCAALIREGSVGINGAAVTRKAHKVSAADELVIRGVEDAARRLLTGGAQPIAAQDLPLDVLYEDGDMIVLNKAAGMVVHPGAGNWDGTVVNALAHYLSRVTDKGRGDFIGSDGTVVDGTSSSGSKDGAGEGVSVEGGEKAGPSPAATLRPGIVHRLDKGTTGVLIVAKTRAALAALSEAFARRRVRKTYTCITVGNPGERVVIDKPIERHPVHRQRMRVVPDHGRKSYGDIYSIRRDAAGKPGPRPEKPGSPLGRRALSLVDGLAFDGKLAVAEVRIETGRTHQIRVHLQDRGTPVHGDGVYGLADWNRRLRETRGVARPLLHAARVELDHPVTGERMVLTAPMAPDMIAIADNVWPQGREERPELFGVAPSQS